MTRNPIVNGPGRASYFTNSGQPYSTVDQPTDVALIDNLAQPRDNNFINRAINGRRLTGTSRPSLIQRKLHMRDVITEVREFELVDPKNPFNVRVKSKKSVATYFPQEIVDTFVVKGASRRFQNIPLDQGYAPPAIPINEDMDSMPYLNTALSMEQPYIQTVTTHVDELELTIKAVVANAGSATLTVDWGETIMVEGDLANGASLGNEHKIGNAIFELVCSLKNTIDWKDANAAMKIIAENANPVVNKEIDRVLAEKLPFVPSFATLGENEKSIYVEVERQSACSVPDHGYLPERYTTSVTMDAYNIGYSVDIYTKHIKEGRYDIIARILEMYVNGITNKIYLDVMSLLVASAYYRNIVITYPDFDICKIIQVMNGNECGVNGMTDLFVDDETYTKIFDTLETSCTDENMRMNFHVHRVPELNIGDDLYNVLTLPVDNGV